MSATEVAAPPARNAPCPCGSGKRYKDCHGALTPGATDWVRRALGQLQARDYAGAEASFRQAGRITPDDARIHADIATLCILQGRHDDAEAPLLEALALDPEHAYALCLLVHIRQRRCAWDGLGELQERVRRVLDRGGDTRYQFSAFPVLAMPTTPQQQFVAAKCNAQVFSPPAPAPRPHVVREHGERLRIGFVSSDFRPHAVANLMMELWERLDRRRLELFAYGIAPEDRGRTGQRIHRAFEHFADVTGEAAPRIAERMRGDGIEVLFDLNGYTTHSRSEIFVLRPAPVQISWLGYLGTLGSPCYDYVLTDRFVCPPELQPYFSERFLYLPDCYCPSDTRREVAPQAASRAACGLPEKGLVFCCFNNSYKILPPVFDVWMRLLAAVPESVLWLALGNVTASVNLRREAATRGIDPRRLVFAPRVSLAEHLARHVHADLFLDTAPYNAGTTANDALFMGVPVLTCAGATMASRVAGSQLSAVGLPELITTNFADYEALALKLAREPARLRDCRERLRANRNTCPLFDMTRFARDFEAAMERIWAEQNEQ